MASNRFRLLCGVVLSVLLSWTAAFAQTRSFDVPADAAVNSIPEFARQAGIQIVAPADQLGGVRTNAVKGSLDLHAALADLLAGTNIEVASDNGSTIMLKVRSKNVEAASNSGAANPSTIETVIVTGTNIRGATNAASPLSSYTKDQIDLSGLGSVNQFIRRLPENFNGGASDETVGSLLGGGNAVNSVGGTGVNLRGLGSDATLVLVDGHRIAPANESGNFVDISMIPLSAIQRLDVLPDGATAVYGSDAVGGVVNFVLRHDFDGAETRARFGATSDGGGQEETFGQTFGHAWADGSALLSYEYDSRAPIFGRDRSYSSSGVDPFTLVPAQNRNSLFAELNQTIDADVEIFAEGSWSHRSSFSDANFVGFGDQHATVSTSNYGGTAGARIGLPDDRQLEISTTYGANDTNRVNNFFGSAISHTHTATTVTSVDAKVDGPLFSLPAGPVLFALGGQFRHETFDSRDLLFGSVFAPDRNVVAGFVEFSVPLIGPPSTLAHNVFEVDLADRFENYSDFGSTNNPKLGLVWRPTNELQFRGTYGTSFRAPLLNDLNPIPFQVVALPEFDPATSSFVNALIVFGGNPKLRPETATNWTAGFDFSPDGIPGLRLSATYYRIRFKGLITTAQTAGLDLFNALADSQAFGSLLQRNPPLAEVQSLIANTQEFDDFTGIPGGVDPATIVAVIDSRSANLAFVHTDGLDFKLDYATDLPIGTINAGVDGTYIFNLREKVTPATPIASILNTQYNPVDLKLRAQGILRHGSFDFGVFVNYVDSYHDNRSAPAVPIASWLTVDLSADYRFDGEAGEYLDGTVVTLSATNVADTNPPFVASPQPVLTPGLVFDGANANVWGRVISVQLTKQW